MRAMGFDGKEAVKEWMIVVGTTDDGQRICAFYAREQRADGSCSFLDANRLRNYIHMDRYGRIDKERVKRKNGAEPRMAGKQLKEGSGEGTAGKDTEMVESTDSASRQGQQRGYGRE